MSTNTQSATVAASNSRGSTLPNHQLQRIRSGRLCPPTRAAELRRLDGAGMWPIDQLRRRRYHRRYKAALIVLLGAHMFPRLDPARRAQVEAEMSANFNRSDTPAAGWRRSAQWDTIAAFRAAAMEQVGIEPPIPGLSWSQLFAPWAHWRKWPQWPVMRNFDSRPAYAVLDFRPMDGATEDAKAVLRSSGIEIGEVSASADTMHVAV
jgi:hypothetical protein